MGKRATLFLVFMLGVSLTVGVYETRRLMRNTARALQVASSQVQGENPNAAAQQARRQALRQALEEENGPNALARMKERRDPRTALRSDPSKRSLQARQRFLSQLSPEEIEELKARKKARRDRRRVQREGEGAVPPNPADPGAAAGAEPVGEGPEAPVDTGLFDLARPDEAIQEPEDGG